MITFFKSRIAKFLNVNSYFRLIRYHKHGLSDAFNPFVSVFPELIHPLLVGLRQWQVNEFNGALMYSGDMFGH